MGTFTFPFISTHCIVKTPHERDENSLLLAVPTNMLSQFILEIALRCEALFPVYR